MIRVANVLEEAKVGGPQRRIIQVAKAIRNEVHTTFIFPKDNAEPLRKLCTTHQVDHLSIPLSRITRHAGTALRYILCFPLEIWRLVRIFRRHDFDIVHASGGAWQYKAVIAGYLAGLPVVWHLNDTSMPTAIRIIFSIVGRLPNGFIFASRRTQSYYAPLISTDVPRYVIPAPVDTTHYNKNKPNETRGKLVVGTVTNINPVKGLEVLIKVAAKVQAILPRSEFVIVGPIHKNQQRYYKRLTKLSEELGVANLIFAGGTTEPKEYLKEFDLYLCTSHAESSPLAVWEAMSMELPIISTDVGDVSVYVADNCGLISDVGDHKDLAKHIIALANDIRRRAEYGKRARQTARDRLDLTICADLHIEAYAQIS